MAKKRSHKSRKKSYLKRVSRRTIRRISRRKDKRKIKKTRKKNKRGGANIGLTDITPGQLKRLQDHNSPAGEPEIQPSPELQPEPVASLSRLSSSRTVNVDDELLSKPNIGVINGHASLGVKGEDGRIINEFLVVPDGIYLWLPTGAGDYLSDLVDSKFRKYGPGSLIQEQTLDTLYTLGAGDSPLDRVSRKKDTMVSYIPSFIITGKNRSYIDSLKEDTKVAPEGPGVEIVSSYHGIPVYGIPMLIENRPVIEDLVLSEHDERIIPKSELLTEDKDGLIIQQIKLSEILKKISEAQKKYSGDPKPIPRNWIGQFCRNGIALNIDVLKKFSGKYPDLSLDDSDFGGVISYEQRGESKLTHQSSLSSRRVPGNFKQIVEELYRLCSDTPERVNTPSPKFIDTLKSIKTKIDNIETLSIVEVFIVFSLRKLNL